MTTYNKIKGEYNNKPNELGYVLHNGVRHDKDDTCPWCPTTNNEELKRKIRRIAIDEQIDWKRHPTDPHKIVGEQIEDAIVNDLLLLFESEYDRRIAEKMKEIEKEKQPKISEYTYSDKYLHGYIEGLNVGLDKALEILKRA